MSSLSLVEKILVVWCFLLYFLMITPKTRRWVGEKFRKLLRIKVNHPKVNDNGL